MGTLVYINTISWVEITFYECYNHYIFGFTSVLFGALMKKTSAQNTKMTSSTSVIDKKNSTNIWDRSVPVEKSSYVFEAKPILRNIDGLSVPQDSLTMIDLFCGAGGFSVGCSWAGFFPVLGIDYLEPAVETWSNNHPKSVSYLGDISKIDPEYVKQVLIEKGVSKINLITGGVPCQGFSIANRKRNDFDKRNYLFIEYLKFVKVFNPDYIILENVSGMRSTAKGYFEKNIKKGFKKLGYFVTVAIVNAVDFGVPQYRQRLFFVGVREESGFKIPYIFPKGSYNSEKHRTVRCAISDLPHLGNNEQKTEYIEQPMDEYQKLMRGEGSIIIDKPKKLNNHTAPNHPPETIEKINNTLQGKPMYPKFKQRIRLSMDAPSPTQLAGGIRPQFQFGHPTQPRGLSIRERARIQSFPDSYQFFGGIVQERVLTGNAVPPLMVYEIAEPIAKDILKKREACKDV